MSDQIITEPGMPGNGGQLSLFGADVVPACPVDLEGLLAGPGQVVRMGGTARISVVVDEAWRAHTLLAEFAQRGLTATGERTTVGDPANGSEGSEGDAAADAVAAGVVADGAAPVVPAAGVPDGGNGRHNGAGAGTGAGTGNAAVAGHIGVRTAFSACLAPIAARWLRGARTMPPDDFRLDGQMLRMWFIAAGLVQSPQRPDGPPRSSRVVTLRLSATDQVAWPAVGSALRHAGLQADLLGTRGGGPAYRIVGTRRVADFLELIGTRPESVPPDAWPRMVSRRKDSAVWSPTVAGSGVPTATAMGPQIHG
jgi:hypothetical protein